MEKWKPTVHVCIVDEAVGHDPGLIFKLAANWLRSSDYKM
jgi:hypothetical protein